jgi:hypothetical protein
MDWEFILRGRLEDAITKAQLIRRVVRMTGRLPSHGTAGGPPQPRHHVIVERRMITSGWKRICSGFLEPSSSPRSNSHAASPIRAEG